MNATPRHSTDSTRLPEFCDFTCMHAGFADPAAVGACRREIGVHCTILKRLVNKNARCQVRLEAGRAGGAS